MIKKILPCILVFILTNTIAGLTQDTIILKNYTHIVSNIVEKGTSKLRYKKINDTLNRVYDVAIEHIFKIKYASGKVEVINPYIKPETKVRSEDSIYVAKKILNDTIYKPYEFGIGAGFRVINPKSFDDFVNNTAAQTSGKVYSTFGNTLEDLRVFIGLRLTRKIDLNLIGDVSFCDRRIQKIVGKDTLYASFNALKASVGFLVGYRIQFKPKLGFIISGGPMYNSITIQNDGLGEFFSVKSLGGRLQGGINFFANKNCILQILIGGEYANARDKNLEMNFSGMLIGVNAIFF